VSDLSRVDGHCRIGITRDSGIVLVLLDTVMNVVLTATFFWQLRPTIGAMMVWSTSRTQDFSIERKTSIVSKLLGHENSPLSGYERSRSDATFRLMLLRNFAGSTLLLINTTVNNTLLLTWTFTRESHACQLMCLTDSKSFVLERNINSD
jgi:hypothetical protein